MSYVVSLERFTPGQRYDGQPWTKARIEEAEAKDGNYSEIDLIDLDPVDEDPRAPAARNFTTVAATLATGWYRVTFVDAAGQEQASAPVRFPATSGLASSDDIARRLGRTTLTPAEEGQVEILLELATGLVADTCDKTSAWASRLDPVPNMVRLVCVEAVVRVLQNPDGAQRIQETLGARSRSASFNAETIGLTFTERETDLVRNAVLGNQSGSARLASGLVTDFSHDDQVPAS